MKNSFDDIFVKNLPALDLHGEIKDSARVLIKDFIHDNYVLRNTKVLIIHGVGTGVIKEEVKRCLKNNKYVIDYHQNMFNAGCTIVYLKNRDKTHE